MRNSLEKLIRLYAVQRFRIKYSSCQDCWAKRGSGAAGQSLIKSTRQYLLPSRDPKWPHAPMLKPAAGQGGKRGSGTGDAR